VLKQGNRYGMKGLQWLNPTSVKAKTEKKEGIVAFEQRLGGKVTTFQPEEIIYHTLFNPTDDLGVGISPAKVALRAAGMAHNATQFVEQFFASGAIPAVVLTTDQMLPDEEIERVRSVWERLFGGVKRAWRTAVLREGLKPQIIGSPLKDLVVTPLLQEARQQIAVAFGIPQTMLEDAANFATAREHKLSFYYETIFPECRLIAAGLNKQLFADLNLHFDFDYDSVEAVQQDEATKADALLKLFQAGVIDRNEAREQLGYEVTLADQAVQGTTEAAQAMAQVAQALQPAAPQKLSTAAFQELGQWRRARASKQGKFVAEHIPPWLQAAIRLRLADVRFDGRAVDPCVRRFDRGDAEKKLAKRLTGVLKDALPAIQKAVTQGKPVDTAALNGALSSVLSADLAIAVADAFLAQAVEIGVEMDYAEVLTDAAAWAREYTYELVKGIDATSQAQLQSVISQLANAQLTEEDALALLEPVFGSVRAETIAATEITRAVSEAEGMYAELLQEREVKFVERWLTAEDERVCPECGPLDHKTNWAEDYPDGPPLHPNCRCWVVIEAQ
jgi:HK97 family phage portal protein